MIQDKLGRRSFMGSVAASAVSVAAGTDETIAQGSPLTFSKYSAYDAIGLAELVQQGSVTPAQLLEVARTRIAAVNPQLNAIVITMYNEAEKLIRNGLPQGPFRGVPFLLKDIGPCKGVRNTAGSRALADNVATSDSELVKRYKDAGLVILGRTNTPEFGINVTTEPQLFGPTRNPWDRQYSTGGSSGGSAAAVAARIVPVAQGGDGGGSIRIPASCCGVFGMKPSRGRMPMGPDSGEAWEGFVTLHTLSISVRDNAAMLDATAGPEVGEPYGIPAPEGTFLREVTRPPGRLRIAWTTKGGSDTVHDDCVAAVEDAAELCRRLGHEVHKDAPEINYADLKPAFFLVIEAHTAAELDAIIELVGPERANLVERWTKLVAERGRKASAATFAKSKSKFNSATRTLGRFFTKYDMLLTPTLGTPPKKLGFFDTTQLTYDELRKRIFDFCPYTWLHNVAGTPAMSVPLYWNDSGLPVGVQFATRLGNESGLYQLAGQLEEKRPWRTKIPQL